MPEPRETHAAIDARRNARGGTTERAEIDLYHVIEAVTVADDAPTNPSTLAERITDAVLAAGWVPAQRLAEARVNAHAVVWQDKQNIICACGQVFTHDYGKSPAHILGTTSDYYLREHCGDRYARHLRDVRAALAPSEEMRR